MFTSDTLKGKHILVTGGASGLGFAMAQLFVDLGAKVAICGRSEEKLATAKQKFLSQGKDILTVATDVRDYAKVTAMLQEITQKWGTIDGLVNNAAGNFLCASEELSPNAFKSVVDIVLHGSFNCTQQFGKYLIDNKKSGCVLSIVTTYTETGSAFVVPSACAKAGVYAMTTSLAYEWATYGIRLNAIAPGPFPTEGAWSRLVPDKNAEDIFKKRVPLGRFGTPEELATLAAFLLSDLSSYITGECVTIDGGERLNAGQFNFVTQLMPRPQLKQTFQAMRGATTKS